MSYRFQALGPLLAGEGSRAFLGLAISEENRARPVVIIWVPEAAEKDAGLLEKIRRETEHASKLDHPNIVTVMGFATLDEGHARVVEFADGESLRKVIEVAKTVPPRLAARIVIDACTGVHYAHVAGNDDGTPLVHGDLRPETILISFTGTTKVTGYGALAFAPREIAGQRVRGRRVHSAPEQIISGRDALNLTTDVYLLGLMLYECLTGAVPWADQNDFFDQAVLTLPLPPATPGLIPAALEPIIEKACAKKASERYPTPLALREAIEAAVGTEVASVEELSTWLDSLFPQSHQLRADRRHTIDAGIADYVRRQWADQERKPPTGLTPVAAPVVLPKPPAPTVPGRPVTRPTAPVVVRHAEPVDDDDDDRNAGRSAPWIIGLAIFVALIAGFWAWRKANAPIPFADRPDDTRPVRTNEPPKVDAGLIAALDSGAPEVVDASVPSAPDSGATEVDAGRATVDAGPAAEVAISLESSPAVDILLEGKVIGRTPWSGRLPAGKKVFTLQNKELGIASVRWVTLKADPVVERFTFEKGAVTVNAPEGAAIFIDGLRVATAPVTGEIAVYEGYHRILVVVGQSKWNDDFRLAPGQRVNFNVTLE
jgi:eukaryotic-like serine/threonine-protein kinase